MLKNTRLATRVGLGFLSIVAVAALLGVFSVAGMRHVEMIASNLAREHIPAVSIANEVERWSYLTMYATRGYVFAGDETLRGAAEKNLAKVEASLEAGLAHAKAFGNHELEDGILLAKDQANVYADRFHETVQEIETMAEDRDKFESSMNHFLTACEELLQRQYGAFGTGSAPEREPEGTPPSDAAGERVAKLRISSSLLAAGNEIRLDAWRSMALNDPAIMRATQVNYKEADTLLRDLVAVCTEPAEQELIEACRLARANCSETMDSFLTRWDRRVEKDEARAAAAQTVLDTARNAANKNMQSMDHYSTLAVEQLSHTSSILGVGLLVGALLAIALAARITSVITRPLRDITHMATLASEGDIREVSGIHGGGEIGALSGAFLEMNRFFRELGEKGDALARGDYTVEIMPRSESDTLGQSFAEVTRTLRAVADVSRAVAEGDYSTEVHIKGERDELGRSINEMIERLRLGAAESKEREWLNTGVAELAERMRGEHSVKSLAESVVTYLSSYLNSPMATLYVVGPSGTALQLEATCAANLTQIPAVLLPGEGVVGQAALDKAARILNELPPEYPHIASSLGDVAPNSVAALPFLHAGQVVGVVELAFLRAPAEGVLSFFKTVEEGIAIAFIVAQNREKMRTLLELLQAQTEELQAQTEELESQQLALKSSNEELEQQSEELRSSNEELEEKTQALERQTGQLEERRLEVERGNQELEKKAGELELANRYKSEFLANMSHELRTPLNSLLILARMLAGNDEGNLNEEQVASARIIYEGGQDLLRLINEILDLSKVEAGMMEIHREAIPIDELLSRARDLFQAAALEKGIEFSVARLADTPDVLFTDGQRLEQILRNLLSNAFKFTAEGTVRLEVHSPAGHTEPGRGEVANNGVIAFSIHDAGPGIPEDKREAIFEAFRQADGSTSRSFGGTGLGLSISRALAHLLGGEIGLESTVGLGSTFTLFLPLIADTTPAVMPTNPAPSKFSPPSPVSIVAQTAESDESPVEPFIPDDRDAIAADDRTVLVIDDDRNFAEILKEQVRKKGFKCLVAGDGSGGIRLANRFKPSAIILDLGLPDIDGGTVLDSLKYNPCHYPYIVVYI